MQFGGYEVYRDSKWELTNPTGSSVLADTGAMKAGIYRVTVHASASVALKVLVQQRNSADTTGVGDDMGFYVPAAGSSQFEFIFDIGKDERVKVFPAAGITGTALANITAQRIG